MFLNQLSGELKESFFLLAQQACKIDGIIQEEEKQMLQAYCNEMNIQNIIMESEGIDYKDVLVRINEIASIREKNIVFLEIFGLLKSDMILTEEEERFADEIAEQLGISMSVRNKVEALLEVYRLLFIEIKEVIDE